MRPAPRDLGDGTKLWKCRLHRPMGAHRIWASRAHVPHPEATSDQSEKQKAFRFALPINSGNSQRLNKPREHSDQSSAGYVGGDRLTELFKEICCG